MLCGSMNQAPYVSLNNGYMLTISSICNLTVSFFVPEWSTYTYLAASVVIDVHTCMHTRTHTHTHTHSSYMTLIGVHDQVDDFFPTYMFVGGYCPNLIWPFYRHEASVQEAKESRNSWLRSKEDKAVRLRKKSLGVHNPLSLPDIPAMCPLTGTTMFFAQNGAKVIEMICWSRSSWIEHLKCGEVRL